MSDTNVLGSGDFFEERVFEDLDLPHAHVTQKEFYRCTFKRMRAAETKFEKCMFEKCVFEECDLTRCSLAQSSLHDVSFRASKLLGVNFSQANRNAEMSFTVSVLRYAVFDSMTLRETKFLDCELQEAHFQKADLSFSDFSGSDLAQTVFDGCELNGADFSSARGLLFDPRANRVRNAYISQDTAAALAHTFGLRVAGHHPRAKKTSR